MTKLTLQPGFKKPVIVVEIGNDWLKIIEYNPSYKGGCFTNVKFTKLVQIKGSVSEAIAKVFKDLRLNKKSVIVCIPRHLVTIRILEFPSTNTMEITDMVTLQVGKQTPYSKEEIIYAYKTTNVKKEGYTKVMLVIARRNIVNARVEVLQKAGIEVEKVAISSEGVFSWFSVTHASEFTSVKKGQLDESKPEAQAIMLIDIDSNYSDFIIMRREKMVYTRNILIGANHLLENEDAEKWKEKFVKEVSHSIGLYQNEEREVKIVKMFLTGAAKHIANFDELFRTQLNIPVETADMTKNIRIRENINAWQNEEQKFVSACPVLGMCLKHKELDIDLTSSELRIQRQMEEKRKHITVMGVLFASVAMMTSLLLLTNFHNKNSYLTELKQKITGMEKEANEVENMRMCIDLVEDRLDARKRSLNTLHEIFNLTPREIYYTNINIDEKKRAILQGHAVAMSDVFEFVTTLEKSSYFENVKTTYTTTKKDKDGEYAKFEIICVYQK